MHFTKQHESRLVAGYVKHIMNRSCSKLTDGGRQKIKQLGRPRGREHE